MLSTLQHRAPKCSRSCLAACLALVVVGGGCGPQSSQQRFDEAAKEMPGYKKMNVARFGGKVLIDGRAPGDNKDKKLFVVLSDPTHLDDAAKHPPIKTVCNSDGRFDFMTYFQGDGVPVGKYVVSFAQYGQLKTVNNRQPGIFASSMYGGADGLKGLYNDPDKNAKDDKFILNVDSPGKTDYEFDLAVAGKEPGPAGPHAIKIIRGL